MKKITAIIICATLVLALFLTVCSADQITDPVLTVTGTVKEDTKFGAVLTDFTPEDFTDIGFETGDSCDVTFGNGYSLIDVPVYNGWYVHDGDPVIISNSGVGNVRITLNNIGLWNTSGLSNGDTVSFTLNQKGKYSEVQETVGQETSDDRNDFDSDEQYCNFRALSGGHLKSSFLFRGASAVDNNHSRVAYVNTLLQANGIRYILDLADTEEEMAAFMQDEPVSSCYAGSLYQSGKMGLLGLGVSYKTDNYKQKLAEGFAVMSNNEGPVYIQCQIGRDRTGFACIILEALAGATYDEMRDDYMQTFVNYNGISEKDTPSKYEAISALYFDEFISYLHGSRDASKLKQADYTEDATNYLLSGGMTESEVETLKAFISD